MTETVHRTIDGSGELEPLAHHVWHQAMTLPMSAALALDLARQVCHVAPERDWLLVVHHADATTLHEVIEPAIARLVNGPFDQDFCAMIDSDRFSVKDIAAGLGAVLAVGSALALSCGQATKAETYATAALKLTQDESIAALAGPLVVDAALLEPCPSPAPAERVRAARALQAHRRHS